MQRPFLITAFAALTFALALPAAAVAGPVNGPPSFHDRTVEDFVDDDFCGTGADVSVHFEGHATVWEGEDASKVLLNTKTCADIQRSHIGRPVRRAHRRL